MEEDIKKCEALLGSERWVLGTQDKKAIENLIKGYREKEESEKYLYDAYQDAGKKMFEYAEQLEDSVPKTKIKEIFDRLNISDIEPWSTYKVNGQILFDLQELMEDK